MYTPVLLPGKSHGWRSLVGCSPWGREELDTTEWLHFHFSLSCIGEGNGNPLQCSCLENPRDGGAWWAAVYGVAQSRTRLKQLSSSGRSNICIHSQKGWEEEAGRDLGLWWLRTFHVVALTVFFILMTIWNFYPIARVMDRFTLSMAGLLCSWQFPSNSWQLWASVFSLEWRNITLRLLEGCWCCLSPACHKHRMLGLYSSITSLRVSSWCLCTSWHSCSEHVHTGEGLLAAFHGFLVRDCIWGARDACTQECRRGHPPMILARKPPAHLAQQPHQPSPVPCCHCIGLQSLYSGSQQGLQFSLGRKMLKP